jgi:2-hydroxychromene-2-carboxylate isomerase
MARDLTVDLYWSFRSPYSYFIVPRVVELARTHHVQWNVKLVYPLAIRYPEHFRKQHPLARRYFDNDCRRVAESLGMPFRRPVPDPIVQDMRTMEIADEQPYIRRLTRLGIEATRRDKALPFITEVSRLIWDGRVDGWNEGSHLADAAERAGLDLASMQAAVDADPAALDAQVEAHQDEQAAAGHWGVPLFSFDGEPFWGQDRFDLLVWRLKQRGLSAA